MSIVEKNTLSEDLAEVIRMVPLGGVHDSELLARVLERSERIRQRLGRSNIAVELIRETRDEE